MTNSTETKLMGQIEILERRIEELLIQNESLRSGFNEQRLNIGNPRQTKSSSRHLGNFISAATFPLVAGVFRVIYQRIYRLKK